ncbi:MAG: PAS domain-containing protein [Methylotenera sp.]|nr:PAS domain-containing protein [Oligoflexia bacterium]
MTSPEKIFGNNSRSSSGLRALGPAPEGVRTLQDVLSIMDAGMGRLELESLMPELLVRIRRIFTSESVFLYLQDAAGKKLRALATSGSGSERHEIHPLGDEIETTVFQKGEAMAFNHFMGSSSHSFMAAPLRINAELCGAIKVGSVSGMQYGPHELIILQLLADRLGLSLERARSHDDTNRVEQRYQDLLNWLDHVFVWEADADELTLSFISSQAERLLGFSLDRWRESPRFLLDRIDPRDRDRFRVALLTAASSHQNQELELRMLSALGRSRRFRVGLSTVRSEPGAPVQIRGVCVEITPAGEFYGHLQQSDLLLNALFDGVSDAVFIKDRKGLYVMANPVLARILGGSRVDAMLGKSDFDFLPHETATQMRDAEILVMKTRNPVETEEIIEVDGKIRTFLAVKSPYLDQNGEVIGIFGLAHDISERKAEEGRRKQRELQQSVVARFGLRALTDVGMSALFEEAVKMLEETLHLDVISILELQPDESLLLRAGRGWKHGEVGSMVAGRIRESQAGYTLLSTEPVVVDDLDRETRFRIVQPLLDYRIRSSMSVVISRYSSNEPYGVLGGHSRSLRRFNEDEVAFLKAISNILSSSILRSDLLEKAEFEKRRLETILEQMPVGVVILEAPSGQLLVENRQASTTLGKSAGEPCGTDWKGHHADGRPYRTEEWPQFRAMTAGETVQDEDIDVVRADDSRRVIRLSAAPIRDQNGRIAAVVIVFADVSGERAASREREWLYEREKTTRKLVTAAGERLELLLEVTHALFGTPLEKGDQRLVNLASTLVPRLSDWCQIDILESSGTLRTVALEHRDPAKLGLARSLSSRYGRQFSTGIWGPRILSTGKALFMPEMLDADLVEISQDPEHLRLLRALDVHSLMIIPIQQTGTGTEEDGIRRSGVLGYVTLARTGGSLKYSREDLDLAQDAANRAALALESTQLYQATREAVRAREDMIAIVSHDLKNPLSSILMGGEMILKLLPPADGQLALVRKQTLLLVQGAERMQSLIESLLDLASAEAGRFKVGLQDLDLKGVIEESVASLALIARDKGLEVKLEMNPVTCLAKLDRSRIGQLMSNLLGNAIKFTPAPGRITVRLEKCDQDIEVSIQDTGPGIPEKDLPHLFDRYWKVERSSSKGTGLGLFIAKGIVEAHGGRIWVESREGEGATFRFSLPILPRES